MLVTSDFYFARMGYSEGGAPVSVALVRVLLLEAPIGTPWPKGHVLRWEDDDGAGIAYAAVLVPSCDGDVGDPTEWSAIPEAPSGWQIAEPINGRRGYDITWSSGHISASATCCDTYPQDLSSLLAVVTPGDLQAVNIGKLGSPTPEWAFGRERAADQSGAVPGC